MAVDLESILVDSNLNRKVRKPYALPSSLLNARGSGFLAGEFPGGITTIDGVPGPAQIRVLHRATGEVVAETTSAHDGTWRVDGLNPNMRFDVVGRKDGFNDVIVANVQPANPPRLAGADRLTATVGKPFNHTVRTKGGVGNVTVTLVSGTPPSGITYSSGVLSGVWPTGATGNYPLTFDLTDDNETVQVVLTIELTVLPLRIFGSVPATFMVGAEIVPIQFAASGGEVPYTFGVSDGMLPSGLSLSGAGLLTGEPDIVDEYSFTVRVQDARGATLAREFSTEVKGLRSAQHWRIQLIHTNTAGGDRYFQVGELYFNDATPSGGMASSSGNYSGSYGPEKAFNGLKDGGWCSSSGGAGQWLAYEFTSGTVVTSIKVVASTGSDVRYAPKDFRVQCSDDGSTWETVGEFYGEPDWTASEERRFEVQ